jgi:large conductance mechanosensitive channel
MDLTPFKNNPLKNPAISGTTKAATRAATTLVDEFKAFAFKGNVIDLAVGVIIGSAFAKIVDSLVKHLIMPLLGVLLPGNQGYIGWKWTIEGQEIPYGLFLSEVINFLIVAAALFFFVVKFLGWIMHIRKREAVAPLPPTRDQELLIEIRDLLKQSRSNPRPDL